jgi:hypothetical protein
VPEQVIVGEAIAGQSKQILSQIDALIAGVNTSTFDLAELLHKVKKNALYAPENESFGEYAKGLDLKVSKSYYLVRIVEAMDFAGIPRSIYEPVGLAKLRVISRMKFDGPNAVENPVEKLQALVETAPTLSLEELGQQIAQAQGLTGDDAMVWINITLKKAARDEVVKPALDLAKKNIGSVGKDEDGMSKDASDGAALEAVCADFLSDPNNFYEEPTSMDESMGIITEESQI